MKISILGCGNGGMALAAYYTQLGHEIHLWSDASYASKLQGLTNGTGIAVQGYINGSINVKKATVNLQEAISGTDIIILCLPRPAHGKVLNECVHHITEQQIIIILPGNFSTWELDHYLLENNITKKLKIIESNTFPFACRSYKPGEVEIHAVKSKLGLASKSITETQEIAEKIQSLLPMQLDLYPDTIILGLENTAGITHPLNMLFSATRIDNGDHDFYFYKDGISEKTALVHEKIDEERMTICELWGYKARKCVEIDNDLYSTHFVNMYQSIKESKTWNNKKKVPATLEHRYVTEDVPYLLGTWYLLGKMKGYTAETIKSTIHLFSIINETNYFDMIKYVK